MCPLYILYINVQYYAIFHCKSKIFLQNKIQAEGQNKEIHSNINNTDVVSKLTFDPSSYIFEHLCESGNDHS